MKKYLTYLKIEASLAFRSIDLIFFGVVMPIGIAVLIAAIGGNNMTANGYTYLQGTFGSLITVGICATALMGIPLCLSDYRDKKILKHFFVTPVRPSMILLVQAIINAFISIFSAIAIYVILKLGWGYEISGSVGMLVLSFMVTMFALYGLGMLIASLCRTTKSVNLACTLFYFPMLFLSGATVPFEIFPKWLQSIANVLPLTQGIKLIKGYSLSSHPKNTVEPFIILLAVAVISIILSIKTFKWE